MSVNLSVTNNQYYRLRFRVHQELSLYFKKQVIVKSLRTKNRKQAKLKASKLYNRYQQILNTLSLITQEQTQELVDKFIQEELEQKVVTIFTVDTTKYKSLTESSTLLEAYEKFIIRYQQQNITDKQYFNTIKKSDLIKKMGA